MKIAVTASFPDLDGSVDPRSGRCPYFLIVDPETMEFEALENPYAGASGGVGIQAAQLVSGKGAQTVLTGSCGPNAFQTLNAAGVKVLTGLSGNIKTVVQKNSGRFRVYGSRRARRPLSSRNGHAPGSRRRRDDARLAPDRAGIAGEAFAGPSETSRPDQRENRRVRKKGSIRARRLMS